MPGRAGPVQLRDHLPGLGVRHVQVEGKQLPLRDERHVAAVRAQRRGDVDAPPVRLRGEHRLPGRVGRRAALHARAVGIAGGLGPLLGERVGRHAEQFHVGRIEPHLAAALEQVRDGRVAVLAADVREVRLPVAVGKVLPRVGEALERRHVVPAYRVAHPHGGVRVLPAHRQVLGHALDEPGWEVAELDAQAVRVQTKVELKRVDQLVAQDVVRFAVRRRERHHHPFPQRLGEPAGALPDRLGRHVGLLKVRVVGVEDDRLLLVEAVEKDLRMAVVPALGHPGRVAHGPLFLRVEVEDEVLRLQRPEVKLVVLDLILPEVLRLSGRRADEREAGEGESKDREEGSRRSHGERDGCDKAIAQAVSSGEADKRIRTGRYYTGARVRGALRRACRGGIGKSRARRLLCEQGAKRV